MFNYILPLYSVYLYCILTFYDFQKNRNAYIYPDLINKIDNIVYNVFLYMPLTIYSTLSLFPITVINYNYNIEFVHLFINMIFYDVWFYTIHRLSHYKFYSIHKQHHEVYNTLGIFALYGHPIDAIFSNIGSIIILHMFMNFSFLHLFIIITFGLRNTIVHSHRNYANDNYHGTHQLHHKRQNCNYGINLFMDRLFNTYLSDVK
jgi:sterol desaturase/sphingolipid hydroxylase (fatty acid hydroxylase superfamily)